MDGAFSSAVPPVLNGAKTIASFSFSANMQYSAVFSDYLIPDANKRVFGIRIINPIPSIVADFALADSTIDVENPATFNGHGYAIGGGFVGANVNSWWGPSTDGANGYMFDTTDMVSGDVLLIYIDGTTWKAYLHVVLSVDIGVQANNQPYTISANCIFVSANTFNGGVNSGSVDIELITKKADLLLAYPSLATDLPGAQTICGEAL